MKRKIGPVEILLLLTGILCIGFFLMASCRTYGQIVSTEQDLDAAMEEIAQKQEQLARNDEVISNAIQKRQEILNWAKTKAENTKKAAAQPRERAPVAEEETVTKPSVFSQVDSADEFSSGPDSASAVNGHIVGIDPGHQSFDVDMSGLEPLGPGSSEMKAMASTGTQGTYSGVPEYELNLQISLKLRDVLMARGYQVVLTRTDNETAISNKERAEYVAQQGAEIYVRIHANGDDTHTASGALTMVPSPDNPYVPHLSEASVRLGQCILDTYCAVTGFANLGVQYYDNMTGINWSSVPVTILEMGFMTHENDDRLMNDPSFQDTMVQGIANGIDAYFGQ